MFKPATTLRAPVSDSVYHDTAGRIARFPKLEAVPRLRQLTTRESETNFGSASPSGVLEMLPCSFPIFPRPSPHLPFLPENRSPTQSLCSKAAYIRTHTVPSPTNATILPPIAGAATVETRCTARAHEVRGLEHLGAAALQELFHMMLVPSVRYVLPRNAPDC